MVEAKVELVLAELRLLKTLPASYMVCISVGYLCDFFPLTVLALLNLLSFLPRLVKLTTIG